MSSSGPPPKRPKTLNPNSRLSSVSRGTGRPQTGSSTGSHAARKPAGEGASFWSTIGGWVRGAIFDNGALKLVALALSITLFVVVNTNRDAVIGVTVGVSYTMPTDRVMVEPPVDQVRVAIKGSWRRIKRFDEREIERIHIDLRGVSASEYRFSEDQIRLPSGIHLLSIDPPSIPLAFEPLIEATVPVSVDTVGNPAAGYKLSRVEPRPAQITVRGAESMMKTLDSIATRALDVSGRSSDFTLSLPLVAPMPAPVMQLLDTRSVEVEVSIGPALSSRRIESVSVATRAATGLEVPVPEGHFTLSPRTVAVMLTGPQLTVESFQGTLEAYVEVLAEDMAPATEPARAARKAPVRVVGAPAGVGVEVVPPTIDMRPTPPE